MVIKFYYNSKKIGVAIAIICCFVASCKDSVKTTVTGWWTIDTIYYRNYEIRTCLLGNSFWFNNDGSVILPIPEDYCAELVTEYNKKGTWNIMRNGRFPLGLNIYSQNIIFRGEHQIVFRRDEENSLLTMEIKSDSLYVLSRKALFDYDLNLELIADLERESGGKPFVRRLQSLDKVDSIFNKAGYDSVFLQTGWYYITDTGLKRTLDKSKDVYLITPMPIVTSKNVVSTNIYEHNNSKKSLELVMQLDNEGTKKWAIATEQAIGKKLGFILKNKLLQVSKVNGEITNGITVLNRSVYTLPELDSFKKIIKTKN